MKQISTCRRIELNQTIWSRSTYNIVLKEHEECRNKRTTYYL